MSLLILSIESFQRAASIERINFATSQCTFDDCIGKLNENRKSLLQLRGGGKTSNKLSNYMKAVATTMINPTISGGVLSGGLHAITGTIYSLWHLVDHA